VAIVLCVAALCCLGAAALNRPWTAWAGVACGFAVVVVSELAGLVWWGGVGAAAVALVVVGVVTRVSRPAPTRTSHRCVSTSPSPRTSLRRVTSTS
jgi:hypothetical protein